VDELLIGEEGVLDLWPLRIARPGEEAEMVREESATVEETKRADGVGAYRCGCPVSRMMAMASA
jgi:hypothetical protein